jgi:hypothetical protein
MAAANPGASSSGGMAGLPMTGGPARLIPAMDA